MIDRNGKPTRVVYECKYCGRRCDLGAISRPDSGQCIRRPKKGDKYQPHSWIIIKKY